MKQWRATCRPIGGEATILPRVYDPPLGGASRGRSARFLDRWATYGRSSCARVDRSEREEARGAFLWSLNSVWSRPVFFLSPPLSFCSLNERTVSVTPSASRKIPSLRDSLLLASVVFASIFRRIPIFLESTSSEVESWLLVQFFLVLLSLDSFKFFLKFREKKEQDQEIGIGGHVPSAFDPKSVEKRSTRLSRIKGCGYLENLNTMVVQITEELFSIAHGARARRCN